MGKHHWYVCAIALVCALGGGCSNKKGKPAKDAVALAPAQIAWRQAAERVERAPISLTASDGSGLTLVSVEARSVIEDPLAYTELHLVFENPEPRRREGRFEITLPPQAAISRFAMLVAAGWQEGEVVERRRAQQVYEDFLHRKQDPALLEKDAGNEFSARVFPIEANARKEIILAYSEELPRSDTPYRLLLAGLPQLEKLRVDVQVGSNSATGQESSDRKRVSEARLQLEERAFTPTSDLEVRLPAQKALALRNGDFVVARVAPTLELPAAPLDGLAVLFDTSASRALGFGAQIERLGALSALLRERAAKDFELRVIAFDQTSEEIYRGPASGFGLRDKGKLLARDALGASDLVRALGSLAEAGSLPARLLVISDGVITAGASDTTRLRESVATLAAHGVRRLDVLAEGGIRDEGILAALTRAGLANAGVVLDARSELSVLADKLLLGTRDQVAVQIAGARWTFPSVLEGLQPGDERLVFAELPADQPLQIELVDAGAAAFETLEVPRPLLERAWARAKIESMTESLRALAPEQTRERARLEQQIVDLSIEQRVVSDYTALLVLESANDYARFGIQQNALTSILRVGEGGLELFDRKEQPPAQIARDEWRPEPIAEGSLRDDSPAMAQGTRPGSKGEASAIQEEKEAGAIGNLAAPELQRGSGADRSRSSVDLPERRAPSVAKRPQANEFGGSLGRSGGASVPSAVPPPSAAPAKQVAVPTDRASPAARSPVDGELAAADKASSRATERDEPADFVDPTWQPRGSATTGAPAPLEMLPTDPGMLQARASVRLRATFGLDAAATTQAQRTLTTRARACYRNGSPTAVERLTLELAIDDKGVVSDVYPSGTPLVDRGSQACILTAARALRFPKPEGGRASVHASVELSLQRVTAQPLVAARPAAPRAPVKIPTPALEDAYSGALGEVLAALRRGDAAAALSRASTARSEDPGDVMGLVALGEVLEAQGQYERAARAYGSLIDLFPSRADLRRMAGARLERLPPSPITGALVVDTYRKAVEQRPDQPGGARALAYALLKQSDRAEAFETLLRALDRGYLGDRFEGVERILREDLALVGSAWIRTEPAAEARVITALTARGIELDKGPSTRFVLNWETDANDVDFHLYDGRGGHAYYMKPKLGSGGALYADITTGYGPECFAIPGKARAYPYVLQAHYYARGPMGYGMGKLQVLESDGKGDLRISDHPFVIMKDRAFVELARVERPLGS